MNDSLPPVKATPAAAISDEPALAPTTTKVAPEVEEPNVAATMTRSLLFFVGVPVAIAAIYYGLIASDIYISETRFAIRTADQLPVTGLLASVFGGQSNSVPGDDSKIVQDYILSRDMLEQLDGLMGLRKHYADESIDYLSRLPPDASMEEYLSYYRDMIDVQSEGSDVSVIKARAFGPELAQQLATNLVELSEDLVNRMSDRITQDTLRFARREVDLAEARIRATSDAVTRFRNESRSIDPGEETSAVLSIVTGLEGQLATARAELFETESVMSTSSSRVQGLRNRVEALNAQVVEQRERLASDTQEDLSLLIDNYGPLVLDQGLAEQRYTSALASLELARAEAQHHQRYLITFVSPELPDQALEPDRLISVITVLAASLLVYGIGALAYASIRDHANV